MPGTRQERQRNEGGKKNLGKRREERLGGKCPQSPRRRFLFGAGAGEEREEKDPQGKRRERKKRRGKPILLCERLAISVHRSRRCGRGVLCGCKEGKGREAGTCLYLDPTFGWCARENLLKKKEEREKKKGALGEKRGKRGTTRCLTPESHQHGTTILQQRHQGKKQKKEKREWTKEKQKGRRPRTNLLQRRANRHHVPSPRGRKRRGRKTRWGNGGRRKDWRMMVKTRRGESK